MKSVLPTRKWIAAQVVLLGGVALNAASTGWSTVETKAIILWAVQAATTYLVPNEPTPGGVPAKAAVKPAGEAGQALVAVLVAILVAALVWWLCVALGLPSIVGIIAAILVLLAGVQHTRRF